MSRFSFCHRSLAPQSVLAFLFCHNFSLLSDAPFSAYLTYFLSSHDPTPKLRNIFLPMSHDLFQLDCRKSSRTSIRQWSRAPPQFLSLQSEAALPSSLSLMVLPSFPPLKYFPTPLYTFRLGVSFPDLSSSRCGFSFQSVLTIIFKIKGVVAVIAPWNYPLTLLFGPAAGAIAAVLPSPSFLLPLRISFLSNI